MPWLPKTVPQVKKRRPRQDQPTARERGYTTQYDHLRPLVLARDPICRICNEAWSVQTDHIIPLSKNGPSTLDNLQGLCVPCHRKKTKADKYGT